MQKAKTYPCVLTIAGADPSGGAGIQADIKTIAATGGYAVSAITALTAQNTQGVQAIYAVPASFVAAQVEAIFSDIEVHSIKLGALLSEEVIETVAALLKKHRVNNVVLDPVMVSKNGSELLKSSALEALKKELFSLTAVVTPNLDEAEKLLAQRITNLSEMEGAASALGDQYKTNILIKGGHLNTEDSIDVLYLYKHLKCYRYAVERIETKNTHGTGCTLSSAIASYLAQGYLLSDAVARAKQYLTQAMQGGSRFRLGQGYGPLAHFYNREDLAGDE